jgi:predicted acylesterase/phospholipase RssA
MALWRTQHDPFDDFAPLAQALAVRPGEAPGSSIDADTSIELRDDNQIELAAWAQHPMLEDPWLPFLGTPGTTLAADARVIEYGPSSGVQTPQGLVTPGLYYLLAGRLKLIVERGGRREVVSQCRCGQLLGLPNLLRAYRLAKGEGAGPRGTDPWPTDTRVEAVSIDRTPPVVRLVPLDEALRAMDEREDFRRFVENHVLVRFVHRARVLASFQRSPILGLLGPADREYMMSLGALRRPAAPAPDDPDAGVLYFAAGEPATRAALVLEGVASMHRAPAVSSPNEPLPLRFLARAEAGELIGHEGLVQAGDLVLGTESEPDLAVPPLPSRPADVRLRPDSLVLEFWWYALRWTLDERAPVWDRVIRVLSGAVEAVVPQLIAVHGAKPGLDVTGLALGTAAALARDLGGNVWLLDANVTQVGDTATTPAFWSARGGDSTLETKAFTSTAHRGRAPDRSKVTISFRKVAEPIDLGEGASVSVAWPTAADADEIERLVEWCQTQPGVRAVVLSTEAASQLACEVAERVDIRSNTVLYVGDDADEPYLLCADPPSRLVWVYRITREYVSRERKRAAALPHDSLGRKPPTRRVVRIPDEPGDPARAPTFDLREIFEPATLARSALVRGYQRLARVIEGRSVGIALSGGGAWGFAHVPFIKALEAAGVPIDFVTGTSFGSIIGAIYVAGGTAALDDFVAENCTAKGAWGKGSLLANARAVVDSELTCVTLVYSVFDSRHLQRFIDRSARRYGQGAALLATTEIPFYPVGTDLDEQREVFNVKKSLGWGVRMSGAMPPIFSSVSVSIDTARAAPRAGRAQSPKRAERHHLTYRAEPPPGDVHHIVDGAIIANVPSAVAQLVGADFVIASNVVPPAPPPTLGETGLFGLVQKLTPTALVERGDASMRGTFLQTWKGGDDQGRLFADFRVSLQPSGFNFFELWRGADIGAQIAEQLAEPRGPRGQTGIELILDRWHTLHPRRQGAPRE